MNDEPITRDRYLDDMAQLHSDLERLEHRVDLVSSRVSGAEKAAKLLNDPEKMIAVMIAASLFFSYVLPPLFELIQRLRGKCQSS